MPATDDSLDALCQAVGSRIRDLRVAAGLSKIELSRQTGMKRNYLWRVEEGQQNLSLRSIMRLAIALDVPLAAFFEGIALEAAQLPSRPYGRKRPDTSESPQDS